ncbi:MAG: chemotaxis protein CheA [bacterium]|nr:chemotaxis protein CheA [bacterium]
MAESKQSDPNQFEPDELVAFPDDIYEDETLSEFVTEARGHIEDAEGALLELENDPYERDLIDRVFRAFHTIKGVAGFLQLEDMVVLAHSAEALLDRFRQTGFACGSEQASHVLEACDAMTSLIGHLAGDPAPKRKQLHDLAARLARVAGELTEDPGADSSATGATAGGAPASAPEPEAEVEEPAPREPEAEAGPPEQPESKPASEAPPKRRRRAKATGPSIQVGTRRLDRLVDMVGELVIAQQMVAQDPHLAKLRNDQFERKLAQVSKITRDLQESSMSLRMVAMKSTIQKMTRLVRDVASRSGKSVEFSATGEDTELDRNVVEAIGDPLVHMIRNSIDHGIEPEEERVRVGKPARGRVELRAYHRSGSIFIEIRDDGRGLKREAILAKAISKGIIPPDSSVEEMADAEILKLIFQPGFSTASTVTEISGRGVGMDVVRRNIEALRGKIDIQSEEGKGSVFTLRLPLTLAIIDGMIVRIGETQFVIPTLTIEQTMRLDEHKRHKLMVEGEMINVRGSLVPIHRLTQDLSVAPQGECQDTTLVQVEANDRRACLAVDEVVGQQQVVIKSLGKALGRTNGLAGGAILGDGRVAMILDIDSLLTALETPLATV